MVNEALVDSRLVKPTDRGEPETVMTLIWVVLSDGNEALARVGSVT